MPRCWDLGSFWAKYLETREFWGSQPGSEPITKYYIPACLYYSVTAPRAPKSLRRIGLFYPPSAVWLGLLAPQQSLYGEAMEALGSSSVKFNPPFFSSNPLRTCQPPRWAESPPTQSSDNRDEKVDLLCLFLIKDSRNKRRFGRL